MMAGQMNIDSIDEIRKIDKGGVLLSVEALAKQCRQAWEEVKNTKRNDYGKIERLIVAGMGGSALGAELIRAVYGDRLEISMEIVRDYHLPKYVDEKTLVVLSSYSGTTEETLSTAEEAEKAGAKIMVITSGGDLEKLGREKDWQMFVIRPEFNPCGQPRMALGYSIVGILGLLRSTGIIAVEDEEMEKVIAVIEKVGEKCGVEVTGEDNPAKKIARELVGKMVVAVGAGHLAGNPKIFCNSANENAKIPAFPCLIPEMNHHLLEGLGKPETNRETVAFLLMESDNYEPEIKKRMAVTEKVIDQNGIKLVKIMAEGKERLTEAFYLVTFGGWVIFYLAILYRIDPSLIPWVDLFKAEMKKD